MWVEVFFCGFCGLAVYGLIRLLFTGDDGDIANVDSSGSQALFAVASRLERLYGGKAFVGLRIPDPDARARQDVDVVLITKREVMVVAVGNFSGFVEVGKDSSWVSTGDKKHMPETHPDPVFEVSEQVEILQSYLEQRGIPLPKGHITGRVVLLNPNCRPPYSIAFQPEVISFDKWKQLKPDVTSGFSDWIKDVARGFSDWIKDVFRGGKSETQEGLYQKLHFTLSTSPTWDCLELKGDKNVLGEFIEFKGNQDDMKALRNVKRSKVNRFIIQKASLLGFDRSRHQILYSLRDYRSEVAGTSEWKEIAVKPSTDLLFQPFNSKKARKFKLSNIVSVTLSA